MFYIELIGRVSLFALEIIRKEMSKLQSGNAEVDPCLHKNRLTMGLPCAHELRPYISTKREPSLFEHIQQDEKKTSLKSKKNSGNVKRLILHVQRELPSCISKYIIEVVDVMGDGHCGYRVISLALGMGNDWKLVRSDIAKEIQNNFSLYANIYGNERCLELLASLDCMVTPAPLDKWMTMPGMGLIVASCYNIRFVHFSKFQSFTFLPLHSAPPTFPRTVFIAFINGNHFVQLMIHGDCPLPPVFMSWKRYRMEVATQWDLEN